MKNQLPEKSFLTAALVCMFLIPSMGLKAQIDTALASQLQTILNNRVQLNGNHGVSACVIMADGSAWKGTAGVGQGTIPISDTTVFHGASITKANIATLMLLLAQDGLVNLDSSWHKYINTLNVSFDTTITVRQLLNHTSGIADYLEAAGSGSHVTNDFNHAFTPTEILENIVSGIPDFAPGSNFNYSTSNYVLAGLIAETVTGNPVQQELRNRIWAPLGMNHTYFGGFENYSEPRAGVWWNFGSGLKNYSDSAETSMLTFGYGGANIVSTPEDLAKFARALLTDTLLSQSSMTEMRTFVPLSFSSWCAGYGLGIHHAFTFANDSMLGHDGYYTNLSDMFHSYDYGFTLVTMTNTATQWFAIFDQMYAAIKNYLNVGIDEHGSAPLITFGPNPASNKLEIKIGSPLTGNGSMCTIEIYNLQGQKVISVVNEDNSANHFSIDVSLLPAGIYTVKVRTPEITQANKLVISK